MQSHASRDLQGPAQSRAVRDLLQSVFVSELVAPSPKLWLFFAWISDIEVIDNSARQFAALQPDWPGKAIRLSEVLKALLSRGVQLRLIIREDGHNDYFIARLQTLKSEFGDQIKWTIEKSFHAKGLLGSDYFLSGSMNLTLSGISINGEHLVFRTDPAAIAEQTIELESRWEALLR
ncbi:phospholipase D-like domain-containing protein DpdK [Ensifer sp. R-19]|uniref:phospholipase D-like domain-containing protein DpdK n=1 Tax=Ensifer sp. R-19 TaxID=3404055 RepID=UPI003CEEF7D8